MGDVGPEARGVRDVVEPGLGQQASEAGKTHGGRDVEAGRAEPPDRALHEVLERLSAPAEPLAESLRLVRQPAVVRAVTGDLMTAGRQGAPTPCVPLPHSCRS